MPPPPTLSTLVRIAEVVRGALRIGTSHPPDCCIAATRALIEVLGHFHIDARPLTVTAMVYNPAAVRWIESAGRLPASRQDVQDCSAAGCWAHGLGFGGDPRPGTWPGHLVALLPDQALIDLTL